jgi:uncharacterized protein YqjF (DUF2071 family)
MSERALEVHLNVDSPVLDNVRLWKLADRIRETMGNAFPDVAVGIYLECRGRHGAVFRTKFRDVDFNMEAVLIIESEICQMLSLD